MKLTVLMAVYNTPPAVLGEAIESIMGQSYRDFEFLILDDGSEDSATQAALGRYVKLDRRIVVRSEPHRGLTRTLNRGLECARGDLVARQDADDFSESGRLLRQMAAFEAAPDLILCGSNAWLHQQNGRRLWSTRLPETQDQIQAALWKGNPFVHGATMFRMGAARRLGGYREIFPCSQDYDFFWRLADFGRCLNLSDPLYHYRFSSESVSAQRAADQVRVHAAARRLAQARKMGERETPEAAAAALAEENRGGTADSPRRRAALKQADHLLLAGHYQSALREYARVVRKHPADWLGWAKLARGAIFAGLPSARRACFS